MAGPEAGPVQIQAPPRPPVQQMIPYDEIERDFAPRQREKSKKRELTLVEESDKLFNEGSVGEALKERYDRILAYHGLVTEANHNKDHPSVSPNDINPDEEGISEEEKNTRAQEKRFRERMLKLTESFKNEQDVEEHIKDCFFDLQQWIGVLLKNSKQNEGGLDISDIDHTYFRVLKNLKVESFWRHREKFLQGLENLHFFDYFRGDADFHYADEEDRSGQPITLKGVMKAIGNQLDHGDFKTGGKYELLDRQDNFNLGHFMTWIRLETWRKADLSPMSEVDPFSAVAVKAGWGQLSLEQILYPSDRTQHKEFEMSGKLGALTVGWSKLKGHPLMTEYLRKAKIMVGPWLYGESTKSSYNLNSARAKKDLAGWVETADQLQNENKLARWDGSLQSKIDDPASDEVEEVFVKGNKQGRLGKAYIKGLDFFRNLTSITQERRGVDNEAYRSLGPDGAIYFLRAIAENSINSKSAFREQIQELYRDHIHGIMQDLRDSAYSQSGKQQDHASIDNLLVNAEESLEGKNGLSVSFEKNEDLSKLWQDLNRNMGKKLVSQKDMDKYAYNPKDGFVTFEELDRYVAQLMRKRLGGFIGSIMNLDIGSEVGLGDLYIKGLGRIKDIADNFINNYEQDMEDVENGRPNKERLERFEQFAFAMLNGIAGLEVKDLNSFNTPTPISEARTILQNSLKESLRIKFNLNEVDTNYVYSYIWYELSQLGLLGWLNDSGRGSKVNQLTHANRFWKYNMSDKSLRTLNDMEAILAFIPPSFYDACPIRVGNKIMSVSEFMRGVSEGRYKSSEGSMSPNQESAWTEVIGRVHRVIEFLETKQLPIDPHFMKVDHLNRAVIDYEKVEKVFGQFFDDIKWIFDKFGYDYKSIINVDGQDMRLIDHMLGPKTKTSIEIMKEHWEEKSKSFFAPKEEKEMYAKYAREIDQKPGVAVFMTILEGMLDKRTRFNSLYPMIGSDEFHHLEHIIRHFLRLSGDIHRDGDQIHIQKTPELVDKELFRKLFKVHGRSMEEISFWELLYVTLSVLLASAHGGVTRKT